MAGRSSGSDRWGWHQLDRRWASRLVALADVGAGDLVLDVGAGHGAITTQLIRAGARVIAVELHHRRAAAPRMRSAMLVMILGGVFLVVSAAGLVSLGPSLDDGSGAVTGTRPPLGPAQATVHVEALRSTKFASPDYRAPAGVVRIDYSGASNHTLAIHDPQFDGFLLRTDASGPHSGKLDVPPGKYVLYCTVTGHEAQGMKATLTVTK